MKLLNKTLILLILFYFLKLVQCNELKKFKRLIGGSVVTPYSFPSIVFLLIKYRYDSNTTFTMRCSGSLINEITIVTAAHCVLQSKISQINNKLVSIDSIDAYLGAHDVSNIETNTKLPTYKKRVDRIIRYDSQNQKPIKDIALLKLKSKVILSQYIQLANLPSSKLKMLNISSAYSIGWGRTSIKSNYMSNVLIGANLTIYNNDKCGILKEYQICAGDLNEFKSSICYGDSGGPLYVKETIHNSSKYVLVGIASYINNVNCENSSKQK